MSAPGAQRASSNGDRRCPECGRTLAVNNTARLCGVCHRDRQDHMRTPPANLKREFFETDELLAAYASQEIGNVFKAYRSHPRHLELFGRPLPQGLLGKWLGLNQGQVSKLENGGKLERDLDTLRLFASILHIPRDLLWFDFPDDYRGGRSSRAEEVQPVVISPHRPDWIEPSYEFAIEEHRVSSGVEFVRLAARETVNYGLRHPVAELHFSTLEQIEEEVRRLSVDFIYGDPLDTFNRSRQLRNDIFILLEERHLPQQERLLYGFAARTLGYLAGASSDFYGLYDAAADHLRVARRFADVSEFAELRAWVLSLQSANTFWMQEWAKAATLAERALALAVTRSGFMRATSMRARALARLGDKEGLRLAIEESESSSVDGRAEEERGMILFSEANHMRCIGTAYLWVGEHLRAREQLTHALSRYLSDTPENFAVIATIRADIAAAHLQQKDVTGADEAIAPLLELDPRRRVEGALRRMRDIKGYLGTPEFAGLPSATELSAKISSFLENHAPMPDLAEE